MGMRTEMLMETEMGWEKERMWISIGISIFTTMFPSVYLQ